MVFTINFWGVPAEKKPFNPGTSAEELSALEVVLQAEGLVLLNKPTCLFGAHAPKLEKTNLIDVFFFEEHPSLLLIQSLCVFLQMF